MLPFPSSATSQDIKRTKRFTAPHLRVPCHAFVVAEDVYIHHGCTPVHQLTRAVIHHDALIACSLYA